MLCTHKTASSASLVLEICPNFANPYLTQFSSISGGNCITTGSGTETHITYPSRSLLTSCLACQVSVKVFKCSLHMFHIHQSRRKFHAIVLPCYNQLWHGCLNGDEGMLDMSDMTKVIIEYAKLLNMNKAEHHAWIHHCWWLSCHCCIWIRHCASRFQS